MITYFVASLPKFVYFFSNKTNAQCRKGNVLGLKPWYHYLTQFDDHCNVLGDLRGDPLIFWQIGAAIVEDLIKISALVAVGYVIVGGYKMMISQGEPQAFAAARKTVINALIGMAIAIIASRVVAFAATRLLT